MFSEDYERETTALGRVNMVMRPDMTDGELATLARSPELKIRAAVAERVQTPLTSLLILAADEGAAVRAAVARNPRTDIPLEVRDALSRDKSIEVHFGLLKCEALPDSILSKLMKSGNRDVATAAKQRAKMRKSSGAPASVVGQVGLASS